MFDAILNRRRAAAAGGDGRTTTVRVISQRTWQLLRGHPAVVGLLLVGTAVRVGVVVAYPPAFGVWADTGAYLTAAKTMVPDTNWPFGYSLFLKLFSYTGHVITVAAAQHLLGLAMGVGVYALLVRRGLPGNWCAVAAAPVLLDSRQIILEHHVLSETLFTTLLLAALMLLLWQAHPPVWMCVLSGLAFAAAALTRTTGQVLALVVLAYLLVRRVGWQRFAGFTAALVVPIAAYMVWYHQYHGVYALNEMSGRYLWARTTTFVDCSRSDLTADDRKICPREPIGKRDLTENYLWGGGGHQETNQFPGLKNDHVYGAFARKAILGQPLDYMKTVAQDLIHLVQPGWQPPPRTACIIGFWSMPSGYRSSGEVGTCAPGVLGKGFYPEKPYEGGGAGLRVTTLNGVLWAYGRTFTMWPLALVLLGLFGIASACWRPRRRRSRDALEVALLSAVGLAIILVSVGLSTIDYRYFIPMLPFTPPAAVLAWHRLRRGGTEPAGTVNRPASAVDEYEPAH